MDKRRNREFNWPGLLAALRVNCNGGKPAKALAQTQASLLKTLSQLLWHDQILGYAVAEKWSSGMPTRETCLRFYVNRKVSKTRLKGGWCVPEKITVALAGSDGSARLTTDVVELREIPRAQTRLLSCGDSVGHYTGTTAGSIGLFVDSPLGTCLLTCSHVAAPPIAKEKDAIESPADADGNPGPNTVGKLVYGQVFKPNKSYDMDAALVSTLQGRGITVTNAALRLGAQPSLPGSLQQTKHTIVGTVS